MDFGFFAALIVMLILTAFAFIALRIITVGVTGRIKDNVVKQLQSYDTLIQKKEAELAAIREQRYNGQGGYSEAEVRKVISDRKLPEVFLPSTAEYISNDFSEDYHKLKKQFTCDNVKIQKEIKTLQLNFQVSDKADPLESSSVIDGILEKLSFDSIFKLSVLEGQEQAAIIEQILEEEEKALLKDFLYQNSDFESSKFYNWLQMKRLINDKTIRIKTSEDNTADQPEGARLEYDGNLCEGFQIRVGNKLYDYGVRKCELI